MAGLGFWVCVRWLHRPTPPYANLRRRARGGRGVFRRCGGSGAPLIKTSWRVPFPDTHGLSGRKRKGFRSRVGVFGFGRSAPRSPRVARRWGEAESRYSFKRDLDRTPPRIHSNGETGISSGRTVIAEANLPCSLGLLSLPHPLKQLLPRKQINLPSIRVDTLLPLSAQVRNDQSIGFITLTKPA